MGKCLFPTGTTCLRLIEKKLQKKHLNLLELNELESKALRVTDATLRSQVLEIFLKLQERKEALAREKQVRLVKEKNPRKWLQGFQEIIWYLAPVEIEDGLSQFEERLFLLGDRKEQKALKKHIEHLRFSLLFPLVADLEEKAGPIQFSGAMHQLANQMQEEESLEALSGLSETQRFEIHRAGGAL